MKIAIRVVYKGDAWVSKEEEYTESEYLNLVKLVESVAAGKSTYFMISQADKDIYFPAEIIAKSIIIIQKATGNVE